MGMILDSLFENLVAFMYLGGLNHQGLIVTLYVQGQKHKNR